MSKMLLNSSLMYELALMLLQKNTIKKFKL